MTINKFSRLFSIFFFFTDFFLLNTAQRLVRMRPVVRGIRNNTRLKRLLQIINQIPGFFQADLQTYQAVPHTGGPPCFCGYGFLRHRFRVTQ